MVRTVGVSFFALVTLLTFASGARAQTATSPADFYLAKSGEANAEREFELRLRDDGKAWLVSASSSATHFETGSWTSKDTTVTVVFDAAAPVQNGAPQSPSPETEKLTFTLHGCTLALENAEPTPLVPGTGLTFTKRHCS
jgi:hypothetical protein